MNPKEAELVMDLLSTEKPEYVIKGEINRETYHQTFAALALLRARKSPALKLRIDSGGGDVDAGLDIYDLLRLYEGDITGIVHARAASMAAIILQACKTRQCCRHAGILIHHISRKSISLDVLQDSAKLKEVVDDMTKSQNRLYEILCNKTKKSKELIAAECKKDNMMTAEEAKDFGLIDEII